MGNHSQLWLSCLALLLPKAIRLFNLSALMVSDEGFSRNASRVNYIDIYFFFININYELTFRDIYRLHGMSE